MHECECEDIYTYTYLHMYMHTCMYIKCLLEKYIILLLLFHIKICHYAKVDLHFNELNKQETVSMVNSQRLTTFSSLWKHWKKSHVKSEAVLRKHAEESADPFSLPSKWKDFQPSPSESYASKLWLTSFTQLLCWQDPRIVLGSLACTFHWVALRSHSQAPGTWHECTD